MRYQSAVEQSPDLNLARPDVLLELFTTYEWYQVTFSLCILFSLFEFIYLASTVILEIEIKLASNADYGKQGSITATK